MRIKQLRKSIFGVVLLVCLSFLFSGCDAGGAAKADIRSAVDGFFEDIQKGYFTGDDFVSEYVVDTKFRDVSFSDVNVRDAMLREMKSVTYEIDEISVQEKTGTCQVFVTAADFAAALDAVDTDELTLLAFWDVVEANREKTVTTEVLLSMELDATGKWVIADTKPLVDILLTPCADVKLSVSNTEVIGTFFDCLKAEDWLGIGNICVDYDGETYFSNVGDLDIFLADAYSMMTYNVLETRLDDATGITEVDVEITTPDIAKIDSELLASDELLSAVYEKYILTMKDGDHTEAMGMAALLTVYSEYLMPELSKDDVPMITYQGTIVLMPNEEDEKGELPFLIQTAPDELVIRDSIFVNIDEDKAQEILLETIDRLLENDQVDEETLKKIFPNYSSSAE